MMHVQHSPIAPRQHTTVVDLSEKNGTIFQHYAVDPMLFASGNPFKCHEEVLYLQPLISPKRFDIFSPLTGGCSEGLGVL